MQEALQKAAWEAVSPAYIFSEQKFIDRAQLVRKAFGDKTDICFSIKANPFLLSVLPDEFSKIEVCSPGELEICKALGIEASKIIFSGVNKSEEEIEKAVDYGAAVLTAESYSHLEDINTVSIRRGIVSEVLLRLSCESQFGMDKSDLLQIIENKESYPGIKIVGIHYFTGTQKSRPKEIIKELTRLGKLLDTIESDYEFKIERVEYGTGLSVDYFATDDEEAERSEQTRLEEISQSIREMAERVHLTVEMGRFFAAPCGYYVTSVADTKFNDGLNYAIVDGGLHQLKYDGQIQGMQIPVITHMRDGIVLDRSREEVEEEHKWTLCGSLCTTADVIARGAVLPGLKKGDRLTFHRVGAYSVYEGFSMFLSRDLPSVYILDKNANLKLVRERIETAQFNLCKGYTVKE